MKIFQEKKIILIIMIIIKIKKITIVEINDYHGDGLFLSDK